MTPRERMLRILSLLQTGQAWSAADLARALETTPRTLRRDLDQLRALGYPVRSTRGPGGSYRLVPGRAIPPLMFDDDEAIAALLGLTLAAAGAAGPGIDPRVAERAIAKLERVFPAPVRHRAQPLLAAIDVGTAQPGSLPLLPIATAITTPHRLRFDYPPGTPREVEPARLVHLNRRWYLYAWDLTRRDWRTFRLDRLTDAPISAERFLPRQLPTEDVAAHLRDQAHGRPERQITVLLDADPATAADRLHRIDGDLEPLPDGRTRYRALVDSDEWLALVLLLTDLEFTVESPDSFARYLRAQAGRLTRAVS